MREGVSQIGKVIDSFHDRNAFLADIWLQWMQN
jgi:hypothetical protein